MLDPKRLSEGDDDLVRSLVESSKLDVPSPAAAARALSVFSATPLNVPSPTRTLSLAKTALTACAGIGFVAGAMVLWRPTAPAPRSVPAAARVQATEVDQTASAPPLPMHEATTPEQPPQTPSAKAPVKSTRRSTRLTTATKPSLAEEVALLQSARRALVAKAPQDALLSLGQYERCCQDGTLQLEAQVLKVQALSAHGDVAAARALGERVLHEHPQGAHAQRVQALLAGLANQ